MRAFFKRAATLIRLAAYDFKAAYAGLSLGTLWSMAEPLVTIAVYWVVYTVIFGGGDVNGVPYYLWLSAGVAPWIFISNGIRMMTAAFRDYSFLVKKLCFDISMLPGVRCISALISHMVFLGLIIIVCAWQNTSINLIYLMQAIIIAIIFVYSIGKILAILCSLYKDIQNIAAVILNVGFWLTPVFWGADILREGTAKIVYTNPIAHIIEGYRSGILYAKPIDFYSTVYVVAICVVLFGIGYVMERKYLPCIADRL